MPRFYVEMTVSFAGEVEANSAEEAESMAIYDDTIPYCGVDEVSVTELEEEEEE